MKLFFIPIIAFFMAAPAQAFFIEPAVSYAFGKYDMRIGSGGTEQIGDSESLQGEHFAVRIGSDFLGLMYAGLEAQVGKGKVRSLGSLGTVDFDKHQSLGLLVGVNLPFFRAWGVYNVIDDFTFDNATVGKLDGRSVKFGVSFTPLLLVSFTLEHTFHRKNDDFNSSFTSFGLSIPFGL